MKKTSARLRPAALALSALAAFGLAGAARAAEPENRRQPLWELGVAGFAVSTPAYPGSKDRSTRALAVPLLIYRGKVLRSDQEGVGARLVRTDKLEFDVGFAAALPADSDDVAVRAGMPSLGTLVEFGPRVKYTLARPTPGSRVRIELPLRTVIEVRGGLHRQGWTFEPRLAYETRDLLDGWSLDANVGFVTGDDDINRYFYEVAPQFATAARPAYSAGAGLMLLRAGLSASRKINPDLRVFGYVRYDSYANSANRDSPLFTKDSGASAGIGFAWTLARSARMADD